MGGLISWVFFSRDVKPFFRRAAVSDMLYAIANVNMKASHVVVDVSYYNLRVGVAIVLDVFYIKFTFEHPGHVD